MQKDFDSSVVGIFSEHVDAVFQTLDHLGPQIEVAAQRLVQALLEDKKILICGNGTCASLGQYFTTLLLNRFEQERPGLPAICLSNAGATLSAITADYSFAEIFSRQIHAIGSPGDVLVVLSSEDSPGNLIQAIRAAHDRELAVVALTTEPSEDIVSVLLAEDVELGIPFARLARSFECQLLILSTLGELIESSLFGN